MKNILLYGMFILFATSVNAQQNGAITAKELSLKPGVENHFGYIPPKGLLVPPKAKASIIYFNKQFFKKNIPLTKSGDRYTFEFKAPDSTDVLTIAIFNNDNTLIDNNKEAGYTFYLQDEKGRPFPSAKITEASMLAARGYASYFHKLKVPSSVIIQLYEEGFKQHPALKKEKFYPVYLRLLYSEKGEAVKPLLINYARETLAQNGNETNWLPVPEIYATLKMEEDQKSTESKILSAYPDGLFAKQNFWNEFYTIRDSTEEMILTSMRKYQQRFKDSSGASADNFYSKIINVSANKKDLTALRKYYLLADNKSGAASSFNSIAWKLAGEGLEKEGTDLEFAKIISRLAVDFAKEKVEQATDKSDLNGLVDEMMTYTDTYALILYKLNNFDSAFYYENSIIEKGYTWVGGIESCAVYAEKSKGSLFAKDFIETQLLSGVSSFTMQKQLQRLYKELNLPEEKFLSLKEKVTAAGKKKTAEKVIAIFGTQKAAEFSLKDLQGSNVSLSSLKGKVIVLDFWATWCGPCRASFPTMQKHVNQYKDDQEVVFIFIDTWERVEPGIMLANATKFIRDNNYSFRVLLDEKDKTVGDYKVKGIPAKFIIDKKGDIVYMGDGGNDLSLIIEAAKDK